MFDINDKIIKQVGHRGALALQMALLLGTVILCGIVGFGAGTGLAPKPTTKTTMTTTAVSTTTTTWASNVQSILVVNSPTWQLDINPTP